MSLRPVQLAVQYLLVACAIAFFAGLLTFIFSFLGAIFCAALAGMMLGAFRKLKWQSFCISLLFPAVIATVLRASKAEVPAGQIHFLEATCFGTFWAAYVAGSMLMAFERKPGTVVTVTPPNGRPGVELEAATPTAASTELDIHSLQGRWLREHRNGGATPEKRVLEIKEQELVLSVVEPGGKMNPVGACRVRFETFRPIPSLAPAHQGNGAVLEFSI